jgi:mannose-6-phosphate isomerase-like protein (cupin superfamily)
MSLFDGMRVQETTMRQATGALADVRAIRPGEASGLSFAPHEGEQVFGFVIGGTGRLDYGPGAQLGAADCFVIPPHEAWSLSDTSDDFRLLHVATARLDAAARWPL